MMTTSTTTTDADAGSSQGPSWTDKLKDGLHQGVTTVTQKTGEGYAAAKDYVTASTAPATAPATTSSWTDYFQQNFAMCLNTVHDKTSQGYEATMELVVGKQEVPQTEQTLADRSRAAAASASDHMSKAMDATKGMLQQGADRAQAALKSKNVKAGGA